MPMTAGGKGLFIVVEGGEGAGKDTQIEKLVAYLRSLDFEVVQTFEPGAIEPDVRTRALAHKMDPREQVRIFSAERGRHVAELIRPALDRDEIVVSNRFSYSMKAYQGYGYGVPLEEIETANQKACGDTKPDLVILLDVGPVVGLDRFKKRGEKTTTFEVEQIAFHQRVHDGFHVLATRNPIYWRIVDAIPPIEEVWLQVKVIVDQLLRARGLVANGGAK